MLLQLRLASGYLAIFIMPTLLLVGMRTGHPSLAFGCVMLVFPMARAIFGAHQRAEPVLWSEGIATFLDRLPVAYGITLTSSVLLLAHSLRNGAAISFSFAVFAGLSLWMTMLFATCPAHDLIHRRQAPDRAVGQIVAGLAGYPFLGFEHMSGNMWEYCNDRFGATAGPSIDPVGPSAEFGWDRIIAGGGWMNANYWHIHCAYFNHDGPQYSWVDKGFRLCRSAN